MIRSSQSRQPRKAASALPFTVTPVAALIAATLLGTPCAYAAEADDAANAANAANAADANDASKATNPTDAAPPQTPPQGTPAAEAPPPQQLGGVTVRSRNRIERLQDVPLSISVVGGAELERLGATDIKSITQRAANVSWNQGNQRTSSISIRGVGKMGQTEAQDPSVGLIVDGVSYAYNALSSSFDFTDVDTIEVARGPQGTLLGKNSSLGSIVIYTRKPSFTPSADYALTFSQRGGFKGTLAAGGPVIDDLLAWRGTFVVNHQQGDFVNAYNRDQTYTNTDRVYGRVQFLFTPDPDVSARFSFDRAPRAGEATNGRTVNLPTPSRYADGTPNTALSNEQRLSRSWFTQNTGYSVADYFNNGTNYVNNDAARPLVTGSNGAAAEVNWKLGNGHTLTSITAYKDYHFNAVNDEGTPFDVLRNAGGFWNDYRQVSQELRIGSPTDGFVTYQGGLYFINVHNSVDYQKVFGNDAGAWFASNSQYNNLNSNAEGRLLMQNSLANLMLSYNNPTGLQKIHNKSGAAFAQANWHLSEPLTLTTGLRLTKEHRTNIGSSFIRSNGNAPELNPASQGGFNSAAGATTIGGVSYAAGDLVAGNSAAQLALADTAAQKYFGAASYGALTAAQKSQIAAAKAIRATQLGTLFPPTAAEPYSAVQPAFVLSPSYKFSPELTGYASFQHGEKAGIAQFVNGISYRVEPEKTNSFEVGFKSVLLDKTLVFNADVFLTRVTNFQQSIRVADTFTTNQNIAAGNNTRAYTNATGNVPKVQVSGLEVDGVYAGIRNTSLRLSGAYNRAVYKSFPNSAFPAELAAPAGVFYRDVSGQPLPGAPKYTFNVGGDYRYPVWGDKEIHTSANVAFSSSFYSDNALSSHSVIPKSFLVDWAVGVGKLNKSFDVSLVVKNAFDSRTPQAKTWNSITPAVPRTAGIQFTGRL